MLDKMSFPDFEVTPHMKSILETNTLGCCIATIPEEDDAPSLKKKKQENTMHVTVNTPTTKNDLETSRVDYLEGALSEAQGRIYSKLSKTFNLEEPDAPRSPKELVERLKEGKFTFKKFGVNDDGSWREPDDFHPTYRIMEFITWFDPAKPADRAGFNAAYERMSAAFRTAERLIMTASPEMGLKALEEFESKDYTTS